MADQFASPSGRKLVEEIAGVFRTKPIFRRWPPHVLFVCGGPVSGGTASMRSEFISWARTALPDFTVLLAENAFKEALLHDPPRFINLAIFEKLVAEISDCILIFPESAGSFAEIGYFAAIEEVRTKVLVVNDRRFEAVDSFVSLGPVSAINVDSYLQPALHVNSPGAGIDFNSLDQRLTRTRDRLLRRRKLEHGSYRKLDYGAKFCILLELIRLLRAVTIKGLSRTVSVAFGKPKDLGLMLSVLVGSGLVLQRDEYFVATNPSISLVDIDDTDVNTLAARALFYHQKHDPRAADLFLKARTP
jgi:hypothetical protein